MNNDEVIQLRERVQQLEAALRDVREALWSENFIAWPLITRGRCDEVINAALPLLPKPGSAAQYMSDLYPPQPDGPNCDHCGMVGVHVNGCPAAQKL